MQRREAQFEQILEPYNKGGGAQRLVSELKIVQLSVDSVERE